MTKETKDKALSADDKRKGAFEPSGLHSKVHKAIEETLAAAGIDSKVSVVVEAPTQQRVLKLIGTAFEARAKHQELKPDSKRFLRSQLDFFLGAAAGLEAISGNKMSLPNSFFMALSLGMRAKNVLGITDEEVEKFGNEIEKSGGDEK